MVESAQVQSIFSIASSLCVMHPSASLLFPSRTLLASISLYFQRMFTSTFKESREGEIVLMDLTASSLQRLLNYIYTGELLLLSEDVEELFTAASRLQIMSALEIITR